MVVARFVRRQIQGIEMVAGRFRRVFDALHEAYGPRGWWPLVPASGGPPRYRPGAWQELCRPREVFEIGVGAVLTQRAAWRNVAPVLADLGEKRALEPEALRSLPPSELETTIRSCGTFRRKQQSLYEWADWFLEVAPTADTSTEVLASVGQLRGFGPETVDSVMVYGWGRSRFIADAYARRILARVGGFGVAGSYQELRSDVEATVPLDRQLSDEGHALFVELGKRHCRPRPVCDGCPLATLCEFARWGRTNGASR